MILGISGCGVGISPTDTLAQAAAKIPLLNQLTVGDVVQGFQNFINQIQQGHAALQSLTPDQISQVQDLQSQLDQGLITSDEFQSKVQSILGDAAPAFAFGGFRFFGGPFGHRMGADLGTRLQLTDDQKAQAQQIFDNAHADIAQLRQDAHDKIVALLTPEQQATLTRIQNQGFLSFALFGLQPDASGDDTSTGRRRHGDPRQRLLEKLAAALTLTDDQLNQINAIEADLQTQVAARHMQARDEFIAILTDDQKATLDQIEARSHLGGVGLLLPGPDGR